MRLTVCNGITVVLGQAVCMRSIAYNGEESKKYEVRFGRIEWSKIFLKSYFLIQSFHLFLCKWCALNRDLIAVPEKFLTVMDGSDFDHVKNIYM